MGRPAILDRKIMVKIATKCGKSGLAGVNGMVSRKAAKLGISAEAALIHLARQHGIGTATYRRSLDPAKQAEVRASFPAGFSVPTGKSNNNGYRRKRASTTFPDTRGSAKNAIAYLIHDAQLRERCQDILLASKNFDRPVNQATLVLEDRIRTKAQPTQRLVGEQLVNYSFNEDIGRTLLRVASNDPDDQRGLTQILRGFVPAFRNKTHHHIINTFTREDAIRVCAFVDVLLRVVDSTSKAR